MSKDAKARLIQRNIRKRILKKKVHFDIGYDLYIREKNAFRIFLLIDDFLDDRIEYLIDLYNIRSSRLLLPQFEDLCVTIRNIDYVYD
tara:strand:- start:455 stop:718 length:264 start_codon:yes stop_codon:yes gene_type:complete